MKNPTLAFIGFGLATLLSVAVAIPIAYAADQVLRALPWLYTAESLYAFIILFLLFGIYYQNKYELF